MKTRSQFSQEIAQFAISHCDRAIAFLWFYRQTQEYDDRTSGELAGDLYDEGFPKPHTTRLHEALAKSNYTIRGRRSKSFQVDLRKLNELDDKYSPVLDIKSVDVSSSILDSQQVKGTRVYLERLVYQINGTYDYGFYDSCAVLCRRLMESLMIEVYISQSRQAEIQMDGAFRGLEWLIGHIGNDSNVTLGRNTNKTMKLVKEVGDAAAHDRVYITQPQDIDDFKAAFRRLIAELLTSSGISS